MSIPGSIEYIDSARHFAAIVAGRADEIEERRRCRGRTLQVSDGIRHYFFNNVFGGCVQ
jgi:hypothetical protein